MSAWVDLQKLLPELRGSRVHVVARTRESHLAGALAASGFETHLLEGARVQDKDSFMREVARALAFPDYFGHNWDALAECLGDLNDRPARRVAVLWRDADRLLAADVQTFVDAVLAFEAASSDGAAMAEDAQPLQLEVFLLGSGAGFE